MTLAIKQYEKYFQMGRKAFLDGRKCVPWHDPEYRREYENDWKGAMVGDVTSNERTQSAKAWTGGWTIENLKPDCERGKMGGIEVTAKFEIGEQYQTRSICDHECIYTITVISRTDKTLVFSERGSKPRRTKIHVDERGEWIRPERYSMAPTYKAYREKA